MRPCPLPRHQRASSKDCSLYLAIEVTLWYTAPSHRTNWLRASHVIDALGRDTSAQNTPQDTAVSEARNMGNASSHLYAGAAPPPAADARVILQHDLPKVIYVKRLANGKFIKSYQ